MTPGELAVQLNGRQIGQEITKEEAALATEHGLVVVFGASDDLMEFRGAINDEAGAYDGTSVRIGRTGLMQTSIEDLEVLKEAGVVDAHMAKFPGTIEALWDQDDIAWQYKANFPYSTFDILEDNETYCIGIIFRLEDLPSAEVVHTPKVEGAELTVEEEMQRALAKRSLTDERIALMRKRAQEVPEVTDPQSYSHALTVMKDIAKVRQIGIRGLEAIHQRNVDLWKLSNSVKKSIEERLLEPEAIIKAKLKPYEQELERKRKEEEELRNKMIEERKQALMGYGFQYVPGPPEHKYTLRGMSYPVKMIMEADHQTWQNMEREARLIYEEIEREKQEVERKRQEEEAALAAKREELAAKEAAMEAELKQLVQERGELRAMKITSATEGKLENGILTVEGEAIARGMTIEMLGSLAPAQWDEAFSVAKHQANRVRIFQVAKARMQWADARKLTLPHGYEALTDEQWQEAQRSMLEVAAKAAAEAAAAPPPPPPPAPEPVTPAPVAPQPAPAPAGPTDAERLTTLLNHVQQLGMEMGAVIKVLNSPVAKQGMEKARKHLLDCHAVTKGTIKDVQ